MVNMLQTFESTILSDSTKHSAHLLVVPKRTFLWQDQHVDANRIIQSLGLGEVMEVQPSHLVFSLSILLSDKTAEQESVKRLNESLCNPLNTELDPVDVTFAERVAFERMIPFEQSPIEMESLVNLVTSATGAGLGAYAGFVVFGSSPPSPLLFVAVPAGMILFGAAKGIADALEQGLRERLLKLLRGENDPPQDSASVRGPTEDEVSR
jgi:hypothetical protein